MSKSLHQQVVNVWRASLTQLCGKRCDPEWITIVEERTADRPTLEKAIGKVLEALCPYPAIKISAWLWETKAGRRVAWAQWKLYGDESITPSQACRLIWGDTTNKHIRHLMVMIEDGRLNSYFNPYKRGEKHPVTGRIWHSTYLRRSQILTLIKANDIERKGKPRKKKTAQEGSPA